MAITRPLSNVGLSDADTEPSRRGVSIASAATEVLLASGYVLLLAATPLVIGGLTITRWLRSRFRA